MCIIAAKNKGIAMPDEKILRNCFEHNPDGAGVMWTENNSVNIRKGFMSYKAFNDFIVNLNNRICLKDTAMVMHFRITTHGSTNPQSCHPFPVSGKIRDVKKTSIKTDIGAAHNGVIPVHCIPKLSDTQTYIVNKLSVIHKIQPDFYMHEYFMKRIEDEIKSKMCFLTSDGGIYTIGEFIEDKGILYSNSSYEDYNMFWGYGEFETFNKILAAPVYGIILENGEMAEGDGYDYFIDSQGCVYEYDYQSDCLIPLDDAQAFTYQGTPYKYNENESFEMYTLI